MYLNKKYGISIFIFSAILAVCSAGHGAQLADSASAVTCFIYTDGLLDDLCAIEYLAEEYEHTVIMLQNPEGLADSQYASDQARDESSFFDAVSPWFMSVTPYSDVTDISDADFYLLAPLTEFAGLLKDNPSLKYKRALLMAGDAEGPDGAGEDWNAIMDLDAYRYVTENMTDLIQVTRPECESAYEAEGYPFHAQFLGEYTTRMGAIDENICCYDLQAVALDRGTQETS